MGLFRGDERQQNRRDKLARYKTERGYVQDINGNWVKPEDIKTTPVATDLTKGGKADLMAKAEAARQARPLPMLSAQPRST
jgi:hypothetical protein